MSQSSHIAPAAEADILRILPLVQQYWRFEAIEGFEAGRIEALLRRVIADPSLGQAWLATVDGQPAGYLLAVYVFSLEHQGLTAEIDELFVSPGHRGQGLGGQLLDVAEHRFRMRGCTNVFLQVGRDNEEARAFYHSRGFRNRNGFDMVDKDLG
jgi:ribosomal protein S18 acetylase RimI-like enzyme